MIYILSASLKDTHPLWRALCKVYGINKVLSSQICDDLGISRRVKTNQLAPSQIDLLNQVVPQDYLTGAELHAQLRQKLARLTAISSYRGIRHSQGLPTRGQRTHGNAQTSRRGLMKRFGGAQQRRMPVKSQKR